MTEIEILRGVYLQAEKDIINELARLRSRGLIDYHATAALERVQSILEVMQTRSKRYTRRLIERYFYKNHPALYKRAPKTAAEHLAGYIRAEALTITEQDLMSRLETSVEYKLAQASKTITDNLTGVLLGRQAQDLFREKGLEMVMKQQVLGTRLNVEKDFVEKLQREGLTAFTDKSGRRWSLWSYADMVTRTTARQAEVTSALTKIPGQDLFRITSHRSTCSLCAPYEGRVYSLSGTSPYYPPLSSAFGKIDKNGPDTLANSWLNIHPNCLHSLVPFTEAGKTEEQIKEIRRFSDPKTNPFDRDPRSEAQVNAYKRKEEGREAWLDAFRQWEKYRSAGIGPKVFQTFLKHKLAEDEKYQAWVQAYRQLGSK